MDKKSKTMKENKNTQMVKENNDAKTDKLNLIKKLASDLYAANQGGACQGCTS